MCSYSQIRKRRDSSLVSSSKSFSEKRMRALHRKSKSDPQTSLSRSSNVVCKSGPKSHGSCPNLAKVSPATCSLAARSSRSKKILILTALLAASQRKQKDSTKRCLTRCRSPAKLKIINRESMRLVLTFSKLLGLRDRSHWCRSVTQKMSSRRKTMISRNQRHG